MTSPMPLSERSTNSRGTKRQAPKDEDVIVEGAAADWAAASKSKRTKIERKPCINKTHDRHYNEIASNRLSDTELPYVPPAGDRTVPKSQRTSPSSGPNAPLNCYCGKPENASQGTVRCANSPHCNVGTYHRKCVGLASRKENPGWRCFACRPSPASTSSQQQCPPTPTARSLFSSQPSQNSQPEPPPSEPSPLIF